MAGCETDEHRKTMSPNIVVESLGVFVFTFGLLLRTVYPSISGGDAGELVVTGCFRDILFNQKLQSEYFWINI